LQYVQGLFGAFIVVDKAEEKAYLQDIELLIQDYYIPDVAEMAKNCYINASKGQIPTQVRSLSMGHSVSM
jgi:hypothetical protein